MRGRIMRMRTFSTEYIKMADHTDGGTMQEVLDFCNEVVSEKSHKYFDLHCLLSV